MHDFDFQISITRLGDTRITHRFFQIQISSPPTSTLQYYRSELDMVSLERKLLQVAPFANFILIGVELVEIWRLEHGSGVHFGPNSGKPVLIAIFS